MSDDRFVEQLARFGGPAPAGPLLHVGRPNVPDRDRLLGRVAAAVDRRWLSNDGPMVAELEELIAATAGVRHCVAVSSATAGLVIAARAAGLHGDVIVPAFTFVATAHAVAWQGARPVFCDIDRATHQIDPALVEACVTEHTTGILGVHTWGRPCDAAALAGVAERHGLQLLFDAAPAFGATVGGMPIGHSGRAEVVSLHATKVVNAGEGGVILSNDDALAETCRLMRTFGFADNDTVVGLGTNAKMSELAAAMALCTVERYDEFVAAEEAHFRRYEVGLSGIPGVRVLPYPPGERANFHNVVVEIDAGATGIDRDLVLDVMTAQGVLVRRYFWPGCHRVEPYRTQRPPRDHHLPVTDAVASQVLSLPTGTALSAADVDRVVELLAGIVHHGPEITARVVGTAL